MKQCEYCAKEISYYDQFCSDECKDNADKYYKLTRNKRKVFSFFNFTALAALIVGMFWCLFQAQVGSFIAGAALLVLGILFTLFPFGTPEMLKKFKIKKMEQLVRIIGAVILAAGVFVTALGLFVFSA